MGVLFPKTGRRHKWESVGSSWRCSVCGLKRCLGRRPSKAPGHRPGEMTSCAIHIAKDGTTREGDKTPPCPCVSLKGWLCGDMNCRNCDGCGGDVSEKEEG